MVMARDVCTCYIKRDKLTSFAQNLYNFVVWRSIVSRVLFCVMLKSHVLTIAACVVSGHFRSEFVYILHLISQLHSIVYICNYYYVFILHYHILLEFSDYSNYDQDVPR